MQNRFRDQGALFRTARSREAFLERTLLVEYDLAGNPCEQVYGDAQQLYWPKQLADRWPLERALNRDSYLGLPLLDRVDGRVIGHLACCDSMPMSEQPPQAELLALFTRRGEEEVLRHIGH